MMRSNPQLLGYKINTGDQPRYLSITLFFRFNQIAQEVDWVTLGIKQLVDQHSIKPRVAVQLWAL